MQRSSIHPSLLQDMLDSAPNALAKGQAQYFTPDHWATRLAEPLPRHRFVITDLTCGAGGLLHNAANTTTEIVLGCDIDDAWPTRASRLAPRAFAQADLTHLYPLLRTVDFKADLFTLNPPFDLHWSRERLAPLAESDLSSVSKAFQAHDGRTSRDTIDSTVATLCMALDLGSQYAEGYIIANDSTVQRLILDPTAPHRALLRHIWSIITIPINICSAAPIANRKSQIGNFTTSILYFAVSHTDGPQSTRHIADATEDAARSAMQHLAQNRLTLRRGAEVRTFNRTPEKESADKWAAASEECALRHSQSQLANRKSQIHNLWLDATGHIATHLSLFEEHTIDTAIVARLHSLRGLRPMQLVLKRETRDLLTRCCGLTQSPIANRQSAISAPLPWHACPQLTAAVATAVREYHEQRAPIVPLPEIQRLGYIDETDTILCKQDLHSAMAIGDRLLAMFQAGTAYPVRTQTVVVTRKAEKWTPAGTKEDVLYTGQELAIFLEAEAGGREYCFMEGRLATNAAVTLGQFTKAGWTPDPDQDPDQDGNADVDAIPAIAAIDFTLEQLVAHFKIPEVPDIATLRPADYQANLARILELEHLLNT